MLEMFLIIGFAIAMMVGPIMMIRPTENQKKLTKLRNQAQKLGMSVTMVSHQAKDGSYFIANYTHPLNLPDSLLKKVQTWKLELKEYEHGVHFYKKWDWVGVNQADAKTQKLIKNQCDKLPKTVLGIELSYAGASLLWLEKKQNKNADVYQDLNVIYEILRTLTTYTENQFR